MPHGHGYDPGLRSRLMSKEREAYLPPKEVLGRFPVRAGAVVADVGCGPGFFTLPLAELVGPEGQVHAMDIDDEMLSDLRSRLSSRSDLRVEVHRSEEDRIPLADGSVDVAFMACVLHHLDGTSTLREVRRILRPAGVLAVVEWRKIVQLRGPPYWHRLSARQAAGRLRDGGFQAGEPFRVARYHYGMVAVPRTA